jgi:4-hydroxy-4-methyl-2-oxoglutarate aldolase
VSEPALTIRRQFPRPSGELLAAFKEAPTGNIADAQNRWGALHYSIKPLTRAQSFVGTALTVWAGPRDNLTPWAALDVAKPGDVLVIATGDYTGASVVGDLMAGMAKNAGIVAIVTDGLVRDIDGLDAVGIPVFARGLTPNSPWKNGPGEIGTRIAIGGRDVTSGDIVVGDRDGIVTVPLETAGAVVKSLQKVRAKESAADAAVRSGAKRPDWLDAALAEKGVVYLD